MSVRPSRPFPAWSVRCWVPLRLRRARLLAALLVSVISITGLQAPVQAAPDEPLSWDAPPEKSTPGTKMPLRPADPEAGREPPQRKRPKVVWPKATTVEVNLAGEAVRAAGGRVSVADTPVSIGPPERRDPSLRDDVRDPGRVRLQVLDRAAAERAGVDGLLLRVQRADTGRRSDRASLKIDYRGFVGALAGDAAARLRLFALPDCALATPARDGCQPKALPARNDVSRGTLTADVDVELTGATTLAVMTTSSGSAGTYNATPLSASATWSHGGSSGDFTWSYPLRVPPGVNGPTPQIALSYSSGSVDGRTVSTNNQPSWIGEGFEFWPGLVERKYKPCALDTDEQNGHLPNNVSRPTGDQCWVSDNATISLNGAGSELVPVDANGTTWRMKKDDGTRIQRVFDTGRSNGDTDGEYWVATTPDGTRYYFGYHRLPGYTGAAGQQTTNSTWTVPVYGNHPGEQGYTAGDFAGSQEQQGWRWNLDYVVDVHGNTMSYFYGTETNRYARNADVDDAAPYTRGGYLRRIDYGQLSNQIYTTPPVGQVVFDTADRCEAGQPCDFAHPDSWPDTPVDQDCDAAPCDGAFSPTFWTQKRLSKITTQVWDGVSAYRKVDSWTLDHLYADPGDFTRAGLWLDTITHTGHVAPAGEEITLPAVKFLGEPFNNRVDSSVSDHVAPHNWWRVTAIHAENGGRIAVNYAPPDCSAPGGLPSHPASNTQRCQPVRWTPDPGLGERLDWFHKYVVKSITQSDELVGIAAIQTEYEYLGGAAWHFDDIDGLTPVQEKTWGQWRGYGRVKTRVGSPGEGQFVTETRYFRGMDGDRTASGGQKDVWVTDSRGPGFEWEDHERLAGAVREKITWLTDGSAMLSRTINDPWISDPTATSVKPWGTTRATLTDTAVVHGRVAVDGGWRESRTEKTIDEDDGTVTAISARPHIGKPEFDTCTRYEYVSNTSLHLINLPKRVETVAKACANQPQRPGDIVSDVRSYYDGNETHGATPTKGQVTRVDEFAGWNDGDNVPTYRTVSRAVYSEDPHGRMTQSTDIRGGVSNTSYTPASGGPVTKVTTSNPLEHETQTFVEPAFGAQIAFVDPNGLRTDVKLDALGRLSQVWKPGRNKDTDQPDAKFSYFITKTGPDVIRTSRRQPNDTYVTKYELYDGIGRLRQTQLPAPYLVGGRAVSDEIYDSRGLLVKRNGPYYNSAGPDFYIITPTDDAIPTQIRTLYDAAGRPTNEIKMANGSELWRTVNTYTGINRIDVDPPAGGTPTTTITDARGAISELRQYHGSAPTGNHDTTSYTYTPKGQLATVTDAAGNTWSYHYDELGRLERTEDPDRGETVNTYDEKHQLATTTDSRGETLAYAYDLLGRRTAVHDDSLTGAKRTEWVFDSLHKGQLTSSTRYLDGNAYTKRIVDYDDNTGQPTGTEFVIPTAEGDLAGTYRFDVTYRNDGSIATTTLPAAGALPAETLTHGYTPEGLPDGMTGTSTAGTTAYINTTRYTAFGEPTVIGHSLGTTWVRRDLTYEPTTRRLQLARTTTRTTGSLPRVGNTSYEYDPAGNVTKISDAPTVAGAVADHQCFTYDYLRRLDQAWTPANGDCSATPTVAGLGGPARYWHEWEHDKVGNRTQETIHTAAGDTVTDYTYPAPGQPQPHTLLGTTTTGPAGTKTITYGYDVAGNTTSRPGQAAAQQLDWDAEGHLESVEEGTDETSFVYDAEGSRLIRREPGGGTTLYLPGMELYSTGVTAVTATRYYSRGDLTVGVRTDDGTLTWLLPDHNGTSVLAIDAVTQTVKRRFRTPYGSERNNPLVVDWPGDKGFLGGTEDDTGLTHLGAREYDPATGRFISVDPIIDPADPQQMHGYAYAGNSPVTNSDPTGLRFVCGAGNEVECPKPGSPGNDSTTTEDGIQQTIDDAGAAKERAEAVKKKSLLDIIKEQGLAFLLDFFGITDIQNCFTKGDIGACVGVLMNVIPVGKILRSGKSILTGIKRAFNAYQDWQRAIRLANDAIRRADEVIAAARRKADELAAARAKNTPTPPDCKDNSFTPGTHVLMADGTTKPIEDVQVGDQVIATDPETDQTEPKTVTAEITGTGDKTLITITIDTDGDHGNQTATITATDKHPFWVDHPGRWTNAADLTPGNLLRTPDGARHRVIDVVAYNTPATVHNLTVHDIHTYYVLAGTTPVLAHNCGGMEDLANLRKELGSPSGDDVVLSRLDVGGDSYYGISGHGQSYPRPAGVTPQSMTHAEGDAFGQAGRAGARGGHGTLYVDGLKPCRYCRSSLGGYAKNLDLDTLTVVGPNGYLGQYIRGGGYRTLRESF